MKEIYLIRHGETDFNKQGIVQGNGVNPPLNEKGRGQAKAFFEKYKTEPFEIIYTSTLQRAIETVTSFINLGILHERFHELDEISWGIYEGKEVTHQFRHEFQSVLQQWRDGLYDIKVEKGESPNELQIRHKEFIEIIRSRPQEKILICMHGRAMRIMLSTMLNKPLSAMDEFPHHNLSLYRLVDDGKEFQVTDFNDITHLHAEV